MFGIGKRDKNMNPDLYQIQRAKEDYVLVHDHFTANPELLDDVTTRCIYNSLMAVETPESLEHWLNAIAKTDLSLDNVKELPSGVMWENILGHYERLVRGLSEEERALLAKDMAAIRNAGYADYFNRDIMKLGYDMLSAKEQHRDAIIILNDQIDNHVAIGADADKLFEQFGWQTATVEVGGSRLSLMPICDDILQIKGLFNFHLTETSVDLLDIRVSDPMEAQLSIAQQTIDAFRRRVDGEEVIFPIKDLKYNTFKRGIEHAYRYPFVEKTGDSLTLFRSDAVRESVVKGQSWNVCLEKVPMLTTLAQHLHLLMHDAEKRESLIGMGAMTNCDIRSLLSFEDFKAQQKRNPLKRILIDQGSFYESYQADAVSLAREFRLPLWSRDCGIYGEVPMLLVSSQMAGYVLDMCDDVVAVKPRINDRVSRMYLKPSYLNDFLQMAEAFENPGIFVKKDGSYAVSASRDGVELPMREIPKEMGDRYMNMSDGLAKKVYLNGILHTAYDKVQRQDNPLTLQIK